MKIINPSTGETIGEFPADSPEQIESKLKAGAAAFDGWRRLGVEKRAQWLHALAAVLRYNRYDLAAVAAQEMGKPIAAGESEINKCAVACDHFAQNAAELLAPRPLTASGGRGYSRFDPLGLILGIMPWNFPYWQAIRFAVPALAAGNVVALKHAPQVPRCAAALADAFAQARFPPDVFTSLRLEDNAAAQKLCAHRLIQGVSLTGSGRAGAAAAATAGAALKKTVLELGGSDSFIILQDADMELAVAAAVESRCINSGQSCIAAKRFIVEEAVLRHFLDLFVQAMGKRKLGDPMDPNTDLGPLARQDLLQTLIRQVDDSVHAGATVLLGGERQESAGFYYPPTVLSDVRPGMPVFEEETFGPVAAVTGVADADQAVQLCNQSRFGLGASIWTHNLPLAERLAGDIETGNVFINAIVRSDPRLPFGGVKASGWGRELAEAGLKEFTNQKTVWVNTP